MERTPNSKLKAADKVSCRSSSPVPSIPAAKALSFLRDTRGLSTWKARHAAKSLNISLVDAKHVIAILELQGYVKPAGPDQWMTTLAGEEVSGSKTPRFTRERVEQGLDELRKRIVELNRDSRAPYRVTRAVAFGDFQSDLPRVQSAELGIELRRTGPSGLDTGSPEEQEPRRVVLKRLRGRSGVLQVRQYESWMSERTHLDLL